MIVDTALHLEVVKIDCRDFNEEIVVKAGMPLVLKTPLVQAVHPANQVKMMLDQDQEVETRSRDEVNGARMGT